MSALTDLFSSFANKIRSKTGSVDTYTPTEMVDAIDDVYDAGVASATTSITPSNSSPVSMSANTGYKPTANGYAISSYSSVTPSSTATSVSTDDIVKIGGNGVIVDSIPTPTSITPSNSTPASLTSGSAVTPTANGYAIESYTEVVPSNASPATLSNGSIYKIKTNGGKAVASITDVTPSSTPTSVSADDIVKIGGSGVIVDSVPTPASITPSNSSPVALAGKGLYRVNGDLGVIEGYAISSYTSKTPDDTTPPTVASGDIVKALASGYLYETIQSSAKVEVGTASLSTSSQTTITLGWKPKQVFAYMGSSGGISIAHFYDATLSTSYTYTGSSSGWTRYNLGSGATSADKIYSITNSGFVVNKTTQTNRTLYYFAIG